MPKRVVIAGLAEKLKVAREAAGMTPEQAAAAAGCHFSGIYRFEREARVPTLGQLYRLAAAYGVTVCDLLPEPTAKPKRGKP